MMKQDYDRAKALLAEAGVGGGVQLSLDVNNCVGVGRGCGRGLEGAARAGRHRPDSST